MGEERVTTEDYDEAIMLAWPRLRDETVEKLEASKQSGQTAAVWNQTVTVGEHVPMYLIWERNPTGIKLPGRSWFVTSEEPFLKGQGIRIRLPFRRAFQVGFCRRNPNPPFRVPEPGQG